MKHLPTSLVILPLLLACGQENVADFKTAHGARFFMNGTDDFTENVASRMEDDFLAISPFDRAKSEKVIGYAFVEMQPTIIKCRYSLPDGSEKTGDCYGTEDGAILNVYSSGCPWHDAYIHELAHLMSLSITGDSDGFHLNSQLWSAVINIQTNHPCRK